MARSEAAPLSSALRQEMARCFREGTSLAALARDYDANPTSVAEILAEQDVAGAPGRRQPYHHHRFTVEQEEEIVRRRWAGEPAAELAAEFGCASLFVCYLLDGRVASSSRARSISCASSRSSASQEQIAAQLQIAQKTVVYYLTTIDHKLRASGRAEAVGKAVELGDSNVRAQGLPVFASAAPTTRQRSVSAEAIPAAREGGGTRVRRRISRTRQGRLGRAG